MDLKEIKKNLDDYNFLTKDDKVYEYCNESKWFELNQIIHNVFMYAFNYLDDLEDFEQSDKIYIQDQRDFLIRQKARFYDLEKLLDISRYLLALSRDNKILYCTNVLLESEIEKNKVAKNEEK